MLPHTPYIIGDKNASYVRDASPKRFVPSIYIATLTQVTIIKTPA